MFKIFQKQGRASAETDLVLCPDSELFQKCLDKSKILRRGLACAGELIVHATNEVTWDTDAHQLRRGDGRTPGGAVGWYHGGYPCNLLCYARRGDEVIAIFDFRPQYMRTVDRVKVTWREAEPCYDFEEQWLYVGDGKTKGGVRAS